MRRPGAWVPVTADRAVPAAPAPNPPSWGEPRSRTVTWYDPVTSATAGAGLSGLDFLGRLRDGEVAPPPMASLFGFTVTEVADGRVVFECRPDESTYNPIGMVHGGLLCTLLDSAAGCAVHTRLPAGAGYGTIEIKVSFLEPLHADVGEIEIHGHALRVGGRVAFAEAHARDTRGRLVGHATTSIAVTRPSARQAIPPAS